MPQVKIVYLTSSDGPRSKCRCTIMHKITFRLCEQGISGTRMYFMFRLGHHPQDIALYICKCSKIGKKQKIYNLKHFLS